MPKRNMFAKSKTVLKAKWKSIRQGCRDLAARISNSRCKRHNTPKAREDGGHAEAEELHRELEQLYTELHTSAQKLEEAQAFSDHIKTCLHEERHERLAHREATTSELKRLKVLNHTLEDQLGDERQLREQLELELHNARLENAQLQGQFQELKEKQAQDHDESEREELHTVLEEKRCLQEETSQLRMELKDSAQRLEKAQVFAEHVKTCLHEERHDRLAYREESSRKLKKLRVLNHKLEEQLGAEQEAREELAQKFKLLQKQKKEKLQK